MKFALITILSLAASIAAANGLDSKQYNYEDEAFFPAAAANCVNGTKQYFVESINGLDKKINVLRTCVNGVYYVRTNTVGRGCTDGAVASWSTSGSVNDNHATTQYICVGGKYIAR